MEKSRLSAERHMANGVFLVRDLNGQRTAAGDGLKGASGSQVFGDVGKGM